MQPINFGLIAISEPNMTKEKKYAKSELTPVSYPILHTVNMKHQLSFLTDTFGEPPSASDMLR